MATEKKKSILMQRYEIGRLLGQGSFAKVYLGRNLMTSHTVAIKVIDKSMILKEGLMDHIKREILAMKLVRHPNIVQLYEVMATKAKIYFALEYVQGGELFNKVVKGKLKEDVARMYFQQLINAVDFCHSRGVYHRDLKLQNLLLDEYENLKVCDFGLSAIAESKQQDGLLHTNCGTLAYMAPEVICRRGYDGAKADIWSCGVILFVLMAGYLPFHDSNRSEMIRKIVKAEFKCPSWFPSDVQRLLSKILNPNADTRISIAKIRESSWLRKDLDTKQIKYRIEAKETISPDINSNFISSDNTKGEEMYKQGKLTKLNAFDIISLSAGFDLSGLFGKFDDWTEARFTSSKPASTISSKLEEIAKRLKLKVKKGDAGVLKMEGSSEGRKGPLIIDAEISEFTPSFHLVEIKKSQGDSLEYQQMWKQNIRPALADIVWAWQGEQQQHNLQQ